MLQMMQPLVATNPHLANTFQTLSLQVCSSSFPFRLWVCHLLTLCIWCLLRLTLCIWCLLRLTVCIWCLFRLTICIWCLLRLTVCIWCLLTLTVCIWCLLRLTVCIWCLLRLTVCICVCFLMRQYFRIQSPAAQCNAAASALFGHQ